MRKFIASLFAFLLYEGVAHAEPSNIEKWLMETPASQWDLGMHRLEQYIVGFKGTHPLAKYGRGVVYFENSNTISIRIDAPSPSPSKHECRAILEAVKESAGVSITGDYLQPNSSFSYLAWNFEVIRTDQIPPPSGYLRRIDELIEIHVDMLGGMCQSKLLSGDIQYINM